MTKQDAGYILYFRNQYLTEVVWRLAVVKGSTLSLRPVQSAVENQSHLNKEKEEFTVLNCLVHILFMSV